METKPGYKTTEFWMTAIVNLVASVMAILAARGIVTNEESQLWQELTLAIAPVVIAIVTAVYTNARAKVKAV